MSVRKDLEATVNRKLNMSQGCDAGEKKVNFLVCTNKRVVRKMWEVIVLLYSELVRPSQENCAQFQGCTFGKMWTHWRKARGEHQK